MQHLQCSTAHKGEWEGGGGEGGERVVKQHPPKKGANHHMTSIYLALLQSWLVEFDFIMFDYIIFLKFI